MDPMHAAIKKRRGLIGDHQSMGHASQHVADETNKAPDAPKQDLHSIVASLSEQEKTQLKGMLDGHEMAIQKGGASSEEKAKISHAIEAENAENDMKEHGQTQSGEVSDSDEIAKSMLDSRHMGGNPPTGKPRNLGERMKMGIAAKLKAKGKI